MRASSESGKSVLLQCSRVWSKFKHVRFPPLSDQVGKFTAILDKKKCIHNQ